MARTNYLGAVTVLAVAAATLAAGLLLMLANPQTADARAQSGDLRVDMIGPAQLFVGEDDYFRIVVTNSGSESVTVPAGTVLVRDTLTDAKFNSAGHNPPYKASFSTDVHTVDFATADDDTIGPGKNRHFSVSARLTEAGTVSNSAQVDPDGAIREGDETNNAPKTLDMTVLARPETDPVADLALVTTDRPDPVRVGKTLTYTLEMTNNGPDPVPPGALIDDYVPEKTRFVSAQIEDDKGDCVFMTTVSLLECRASDAIAPGDTLRASIALVPRRAGTIENEAYARSGGQFTMDPNGNPSDTETTRVKRSR